MVWRMLVLAVFLFVTVMVSDEEQKIAEDVVKVKEKEELLLVEEG
jgi:hypothetical protein